MFLFRCLREVLRELGCVVANILNELFPVALGDDQQHPGKQEGDEHDMNNRAAQDDTAGETMQ